MEPTRFELTPEQKGILAALLSETGQPASILAPAIADALEALQDHAWTDGANGHGSAQDSALPSSEASTPIWEVAEELFRDIPDEELARLPVDGAAQHDHYIYGLPKRPA